MTDLQLDSRLPSPATRRVVSPPRAEIWGAGSPPGRTWSRRSCGW